MILKSLFAGRFKTQKIQIFKILDQLDANIGRV
jgi:hypothetical protein